MNLSLLLFHIPWHQVNIVVSAKVVCQFYTPYFEKDICELERVERAAKWKKNPNKPHNYQRKMENTGFD